MNKHTAFAITAFAMATFALAGTASADCQVGFSKDGGTYDRGAIKIDVTYDSESEECTEVQYIKYCMIPAGADDSATCTPTIRANADDDGKVTVDVRRSGKLRVAVFGSVRNGKAIATAKTDEFTLTGSAPRAARRAPAPATTGTTTATTTATAANDVDECLDRVKYPTSAAQIGCVTAKRGGK